MPALPLLLALAGPPAAAAPTALGPDGYAVLVGSARPGPGQAPLRWAGRDAARMGRVLEEVGGLAADRVRTLEDPDRGELLAALDAVAARIRADRAAGRAPALLFYYSGHARSHGLDLGPEELALAELRAALDAADARMTVVVLDACQSGAATGVKGVTPAAAFSTASVAGLRAEGTAVLSSSTASELSQESDALQGGYFTHHLATGLRGAADGDADGTVTLEEAYRYAYDRTVTSTAETAVGRQHPTLHTDLRGAGSVALSRPAGARARLTFGPADHGEVLLAHAGSGAVAAEVSKARGDAVTLALPAGDYAVWWTRGPDRQRCTLALPDGPTDFAPTRCRAVQPAPVATKGGGARPPAERWGIEGGVGLLAVAASPYTARLEDFSFAPRERLLGLPTAHLSVAWSPLRHLAVVGTLGTLDADAWSRDDLAPGSGPATTTEFSWRTRRLGAAARAQAPLLDDWLVPYLQGGGGPAWVTSTYADGAEARVVDEADWGWHLAGAAGLQLMPRGRRGGRHLGAFAQVEASTAPALENLLGDRHDSGGLSATLGLRVGL